MELTQEHADASGESRLPPAPPRELSAEELEGVGGGRRCLFQWVEGDVVVSY